MALTKVQILSYSSSDQQDFKKLVLEGLKELGFEFNAEFDSDLDNPEAYLKNGGAIFLAKTENKVIGSLMVINRGNGTAALKRFYVNKKFQHQGVGSMLYDKALEFCKQNNFIKIELESNKKFITAHEFYRNRGFKLNKEDENSFYMSKAL